MVVCPFIQPRFVGCRRSTAPIHPSFAATGGDFSSHYTQSLDYPMEDLILSVQ